MTLIWVALGGALGATSRYLLVQYINDQFTQSFPYGTLAVNVIGSFVIGAVAAVISTRLAITEEMRLMLMVGVLGAFTTFSSFSLETLNLIQVNQFLLAGVNVFAQVVLCLLATTVAWYLFRSV